MQKRKNEGIMDPDDVCLSQDDDDDDAKNKSYANWPSFLAVKGKTRRHSSSCFSSFPDLLRIFFFFSPSFKVVSIASRILFPSLFIMKSSWFPTARLSFIPGSDPCSKITVLSWTSSFFVVPLVSLFPSFSRIQDQDPILSTTLPRILSGVSSSFIENLNAHILVVNFFIPEEIPSRDKKDNNERLFDCKSKTWVKEEISRRENRRCQQPCSSSYLLLFLNTHLMQYGFGRRYWGSPQSSRTTAEGIVSIFTFWVTKLLKSFYQITTEILIVTNVVCKFNV